MQKGPCLLGKRHFLKQTASLNGRVSCATAKKNAAFLSFFKKDIFIYYLNWQR
jgi:hypothetical protein